MTTVRLDLDWTAPKTGDRPFNPIARIAIKRSSELNGKRLLSPDLMTIVEVDVHIDLLISDLEEIRKKAHKKFTNWRPPL